MQACAKGAIVVGAVASLRRLRRGGRITNDQLAARLSAGALALLEQKIEVARWYPIALFGELVDCEWDLVAQRDPDHARRAGAHSAEVQTQSGRYQQLDFAKRARVDSIGAILLMAKLVASLTATFYNFLDTNVGIDPEDPGRLQIVFANADEFPEALRYATEGFMSRINELQGSTLPWRSERAAASRIVFWMELPELRAR